MKPTSWAQEKANSHNWHNSGEKLADEIHRSALGPNGPNLTAEKFKYLAKEFYLTYRRKHGEYLLMAEAEYIDILAEITQPTAFKNWWQTANGALRWKTAGAFNQVI